PSPEAHYTQSPECPSPESGGQSLPGKTVCLINLFSSYDLQLLHYHSNIKCPQIQCIICTELTISIHFLSFIRASLAGTATFRYSRVCPVLQALPSSSVNVSSTSTSARFPAQDFSYCSCFFLF